MRLDLLGEFAAIGGLVLVFASLLRRTRQTRMRAWLAGWVLVLAHIGARFVAVSAPVLAQPAEVVSVLMQLAASIGFLWAALGAQLGQRRLSPRLPVALIPDAVLLVVLLTGLAPRGLLLALSAAAFLAMLALVRSGTRNSDRRAGHGYVAAIVLAYAVQAALVAWARAADVVAWMLCWHFLAVALLFWRDAREAGPGRLFTTTCFVAWALVFPLAVALPVVAPGVRVGSALWSLPRYLVATGMILTLYEEQMTLAEEAALHDPLTGLPNRRLLQLRLAREVEVADRSGESLALLVIDLDRFKQVNDRHGHAGGDRALRLVSKRMRLRLRKTDALARIGGDEFVALLPGMHRREDAERVAEALRQALAEPMVLDAGAQPGVVIGASIGITLYPDDGRDASQLLRKADHLMYQRKQGAETLPA